MKKLAKLAIFSFLVAVVAVPTNFANAEVNVAAITQEHVQDEVIIGYFDNGSSAENASVRGNSYKAVNAIAKERINVLLACGACDCRGSTARPFNCCPSDCA